jgi:DNA primase
MRQAVAALVNSPTLAREVTVEMRAALDRVELPGSDVLRDLIDDLKARPAVSSGQVIERWNEHPDRKKHLAALVGNDSAVDDAKARTDELLGAISKLVAASDEKRFEELRSKSEVGALTASELLEFQALTRRPRVSDASRR